MATAKSLETLHSVKSIDAAADFAASTVRSDVYSMRDHQRILFLVYRGSESTGTSTITVNSCDNNTPDTRTAIPFLSREIGIANDDQAAIVARLAAGYDPDAGASRITAIEVSADDLEAGEHFVELTLIESTNNPITGCILAILGNGRYKEDVSATVLS